MSSYEEIIPRKKYRLYVELGTDGRGKRIRRTRIVEANGPRKAEELLRQFENEVRETMHLEDDNPIFISFADRWLKNFANTNLDVATNERYEEALTNLNNYFGKKKIRDIQTFQIVKYFNDEREAGRGQFDMIYRTLASIFKYAVKWSVIAKDRNPMEDVAKPKEKKMRTEREKFYTAAEFPILLEAFEILEPHQRIICKLALFGGLRRGEIAAIATDVINWEENKIHISRSLQFTKKDGLKLKERTITLPQKFMVELKEYWNIQKLIYEEMGEIYKPFKDPHGKDVDMLFAHPNGVPYQPHAITRFWRRFLERNQIRSVNFHGLRHSSASYLLSQGVNLKLIQVRLGHKNIKTTMNMYSHITEEDDAGATKVFDDLFNKNEKILYTKHVFKKFVTRRSQKC